MNLSNPLLISFILLLSRIYWLLTLLFPQEAGFGQFSSISPIPGCSHIVRWLLSHLLAHYFQVTVSKSLLSFRVLDAFSLFYILECFTVPFLNHKIINISKVALNLLIYSRPYIFSSSVSKSPFFCTFTEYLLHT